MFVTEPNDGPAEVPVPRGQGLVCGCLDQTHRRGENWVRGKEGGETEREQKPT